MTGSPRIAPGNRRQIEPVNAAIAWAIGRATGGRPPHVFTTLARHRGLFRRWLWFAGGLMPGGKLPRRDTGCGGHVVNVSSAAGLLGLPWHAAYSASKFGLRGVSEVLRFDLRRHDIGVSLVCPGGVRTPLVGTVEIVGVDSQSPAIVKLKRRFEKRAVSPEHVAERIVAGIERNRYLVFTSRDIQLAFWLQRWFPPAYALIMRGMNRELVRVAERAPERA